MTSEKMTGDDYVEAGFAKLQGEDFEYYMQTYSIDLGRNTNKSTFDVDVDLAALGGGPNISRRHARIFFDFQSRIFLLEVLGKNGCFVQGVHHLPGSPPVKLASRDLLRIGDKEFYFLLPARGISVPPKSMGSQHRQLKKKGRADREPDNQQLLLSSDNHQLLLSEDKDVVSSVATVLSDSCRHGEWMPMEKLHSELMEKFGNAWHHDCVRNYLTCEDYSSPEAPGKPWYGLLILLRKYPQQFVIDTRSEGQVMAEFVSLVSPIS